MRQIVLDTETTGIDPNEGHRIIEIGCVELVERALTGRNYHVYINPQREIEAEAIAIHGITNDFLADKPGFSVIADEFFEFIRGAELVIHNAAFDMKFLNAELGWVNRPLLPMEQSLDTLAIARRKFPGSPASLDALCRKFGIDNTSRTLHGALLDSEILAEVYLELIGGRQPDFALASDTRRSNTSVDAAAWRAAPRPVPLGSKITHEEAAAHAAFVQKLGDGSIWKKLG